MSASAFSLLASFARRGSACVVAIAIAAMTGGCSGMPHGQDGVTAVQFPDMVVPAGLHLVDRAHESHSLEAASWRQGRFVYSGNVRAEDAAAYVRQQMPRHNWELVLDDAVDPNAAKLRYVRGYYAAEYSFSRVEGRTQLVVDYGTDYSR
ncbi:MAG: hypothetical protein KDE27_17950 [Planctomycetes bacterium]|nr:hypothetical protein [Planctomycetota bacterium]